jgi:chemotaxis protein methyltransferase CheR
MLPSEPEQRRAFDGIREWVRGTLGISFPDNKLDSLQNRLEDVLRHSEHADLCALHRALLQPNCTELQLKLSQAMTTNHTAFFREPDTLHALFEHPHDVAAGEPLRVWSAACSTGEEPYSLAMLAHERFGSAAAERVAFLATDISLRAIETGTAGRYPERAMAGVSEERRQRYFERVGGDYQVVPAVKSSCTFRRLNLAVGSWPFRRQFHAIYCRNVLYYFDKELRTRIARRLHEHLVPGGFLYTSVTEALRGLDTPWAYVRPGVYCKEGR